MVEISINLATRDSTIIRAITPFFEDIFDGIEFAREAIHTFAELATLILGPYSQICLWRVTHIRFTNTAL